MVIEDSPELSASLEDMLAMNGHTPIIAPNGREGVKQALKTHPDLILLDIRLPDIDGYEVFRQIRRDSWGKTAHIVILTASESIENISKNVSLPPEDVLFKPNWSIKKLAEYINKKLAS